MTLRRWPCEDKVFAMPKKSTKNVFVGNWTIVAMGDLDADYFNDPDGAFIEFTNNRSGNFGYNFTSGQMDCRLTTRDAEQAIEWSWHGQAGGQPVHGRGWAVLTGKELHGMILFHGGHDQPFIAIRR